MATARVSSPIGAPVSEVFSMFTDIEKAAAQVSGIRKVERLTPGRFGSTIYRCKMLVDVTP